MTHYTIPGGDHGTDTGADRSPPVRKFTPIPFSLQGISARGATATEPAKWSVRSTSALNQRALKKNADLACTIHPRTTIA